MNWQPAPWQIAADVLPSSDQPQPKDDPMTDAAPEYVDRSAYAALEAHTVLLTDQLRVARAERDDVHRARDRVNAENRRLERERDEAREQLGLAYKQRTRLADRGDRLAEQAGLALNQVAQEQSRVAFAIEQRDRFERERDQLAKRVAELAEQVTTPAVVVDGDLLARLTAERDDARKAACEGDRHLADLVESRKIRAALEAERNTLRSAMSIARNRASAGVEILANHVGYDEDQPF